MSDKKYRLTFTFTDGTKKEVQFTAPQGPPGEGSLPAGGEPNQFLGTDAEGNTAWMEQLAYSYTSMAEILPETSPTFLSVDEGFVFTDPIPAVPEIGKEYIVTYNGQDYTCVAFGLDMNGSTATILGNSLAMGGPDTGEPFTFVRIPEEFVDMAGGAYGMLMTFDGATAATVRICENSTVIHKVPDIYLPEKTHWVNDTDIVILPETEIDVQVNPTPLTVTTAIEVGVTYNVTWNGVDYSCIAQKPGIIYQEGFSVMLGNGAMFGGVGNKEPFCFFSLTDAGALQYGARFMLYNLDDSMSIVAEIVEPAGAVHKIDRKYLPDDAVGSASNIKNGMMEGSLRTVGADEENREYQLGAHCFAGGLYARAYGDSSFAYGYKAVAGNGTIQGVGGIAIGSVAQATNSGVALGGGSVASGKYSVAIMSKANGISAVAIGDNVVANGDSSFVCGVNNIPDNENKYVFIVGNGDKNVNGRSNAFTIDWDGNAWFAGSVEGVALILRSSTPGSTKRFKITVDDSGALTTTEIVQ